jgi:hypothetical protein
MSSKEDEYIRNYIDQNPSIADYHLEVPYNYYGSRGFVDAVFEWDWEEEPTYGIFEVKSEDAIREATGSNEIIRQMQKMSSYFYEGQKKVIVDNKNHFFRLDIIDTEYNRQHLLDNFELYQSMSDGHEVVSPRNTVQLVSQDATRNHPVGRVSKSFRLHLQWL